MEFSGLGKDLGIKLLFRLQKVKPPFCYFDRLCFSRYEKTDKSNKNVGVKKIAILLYIFLVWHVWLPIFSFFQSLNEPGLSAGIDPGMALTSFSSSIG